MVIGDANPFADSLVYEARLPIAWRSRQDGAGNDFGRQSEHNEHVLRCANLLGEQLRDRLDEESEQDQAILRLEAKVNLLLELVSKLEQRISQIPESSNLKLCSGGIEWQSDGNTPTKGEHIWVDLYVDNRIPEPMQIPARVITIKNAESGTTVQAKFEELGENVKDHLEKMIFRHHRRMIAQAKGG